jgi:hypothetical protein
MSSMVDFFNAQKENLRQMLQFEPFAVLFPRVHALYESMLPFCTNKPLGRFVLLSHKAFLTAASLIGQGHADDAAPIARRAIEMIRLATRD